MPMESFKEYLKEVNPHNIQHQIAALKKQSTGWSEDDLTQIVDCILERVSLELPDMSCLYLYTCRMMAKFGGKVKTKRHRASVTFQDVLQKRVNYQLRKMLEAKEGKFQQNSTDDWKHWRDLDSFCSFLGRLFACDALTLDTLLSCIHELVEHDTEASWLLISKILKDLVAHLESHRMSHNFDPVFQKIYEMIQENHLSAGTSFMLCDLCDAKAKYQDPDEVEFHTFNKIRQDLSGKGKNKIVEKVAFKGVQSRADSEGTIPQHNDRTAVERSKSVRAEETKSENKSSRSINCNINQVKLKYIYKDDQWSPINPRGKKKYDRDFLLTIQPECTIRPKGLPDIPDIVLEKAYIRRRLSFSSCALKDDGSSDEAMSLMPLMQIDTKDVSTRTASKATIPQSSHLSAVGRSEQVKRGETLCSRLVNGDIKQVKLKYIYEDDQWSPINPLGKKKYDRDFLLTIQPECTIRPKGLPDIPDVVLEKTHVQCRLFFKSCALKADESSDKTLKQKPLMKGETKDVSSAKMEVSPAAAAVAEKKTNSSQNSLKRDVQAMKNHKDGGLPSTGHKTCQQLQNGRRDNNNSVTEQATAEGMHSANIATGAGNLQRQSQLPLLQDQSSLYRNQNGKMKHDREFLLSFQSSCATKPEGLPYIVINEKSVTVLHNSRKVSKDSINDVNHRDSFSASSSSHAKEDQMKTLQPFRSDLSGQKNGLKKFRSSEVGAVQNPPLNDFRNHPGTTNDREDGCRERAVLQNGTNSTLVGAKLQQYQTLPTGGAPDLKEMKENLLSPAQEPSEDELRKIFEQIIKEYLTLRNVKEVIQRFEKLTSSRFNDVFICLLLEKAHEGHPISREVTGRLFHALLTSKLVSEEQLNSGFELFIGSSNESSWSEVSYWKNLADVLAAMVVVGTESLEFMTEVIKTVPGEGNSVCLVAKTLKQIENLKSVYQALRLWRNSHFTWSLFAPDNFDIHSFVEKERLAFTLPLEAHKKAARPKPAVTSQPLPKQTARQPKETPQSTPKPQQQIKKVESIACFQNGLLKLLKTQQMIQHRVVFEIIERSVPDEAKNTTEFIEALVLAVLMSTVVEGDDGPYSKCHRELFKRRAVLMKRYLKEESLQMHAIHTTQAFAASVSHPPGLLRTVFEVLYDEDIISEETFYTWWEDEETCETSKLSVSNFFKWLQEK